MGEVVAEDRERRRVHTVCPDCTMPRLGVFGAAIPPRVGSCLFPCTALAAREPIPPRWFKDMSFGVVRRGIVIRQRLDGHGCATAVDIVGPGGLVPLGSPERGDSLMTGYAATDSLLCTSARATTERLTHADTGTARDLVTLHVQAMERMERLADARGRSRVLARIGALIAALVDSLSPLRPTEVIPAELQQADLAGLVAAQKETVCRAIRELERRGLVARTAEGMRIEDRAGLESV